MNRTKYTEEEIAAENKAREELAYTQIKDYIIKQQNRYIGACGYNYKRIVYQCTKYNNTYLNNNKSNLIKYLTIPTQTLKHLAGFYVHTSRKSLKRIPISPIIERLKKEKVLDTISYNADNHRATCYILPVDHKAVVLERINVLQKKTKKETSTQTTKIETTSENKSSNTQDKKFNIQQSAQMRDYIYDAYLKNLITYNDTIQFCNIFTSEKVYLDDNHMTSRNVDVYNQFFDVLKSRGYDMSGIIRL